MTKITDILKKKGSDVLTVDGEETIKQAVDRMAENNVGGLLVKDGESICGIITERDMLKNVLAKGIDPEKASVKSISTCNLVCIDPSYSVEEAMAVMTASRIRHLPVMDGGRLAGIVSIGDLVKQASADQQAQIHYLTDYVSGKYPA